MNTFTVVATITLILLAGATAYPTIMDVREKRRRKRLAAEQNLQLVKSTNLLPSGVVSAAENSEEPLPSASSHVVRAMQELISVLEKDVSLGDLDVQRAIENSLRGRAHLLKPIVAYFLAVFMKAKKTAGASARLVVIHAANRFLQDIERAQTEIMRLASQVLQDDRKGLVDVIVLADFSLPIARTLAHLAKLNPDKKKSVRVYLISSDKHFISEIDTSTWRKQFQSRDMERFYQVEDPIQFSSIATFFASTKREGERVMFLMGAERVYSDARILDWPGVGTICETARMHSIDVLVAAESYKVQPKLDGEVVGFGTAADGSPIQLVTIPMTAGVTFVSDHMIHNIPRIISDQTSLLKCCYRHWLNRMEGKNLPIGIIFDLDGTLIDSEQLHLALYQKIASSIGYSLTATEYYSRLRGMTDEETISALFQMAGKKGNRDRLIREKQQEFHEQLSAGQIKPIGGAVEFVRKLYDHGYLLALATSATAAEARAALDGLKLSDVFLAVLSSESIDHGKPAPDVYVNATKALNLPPWECLVYEDSLSGLQAARSAGIEVVAIGDPKDQVLIHSGAKLIISDFRGHDLPTITGAAPGGI